MEGFLDLIQVLHLWLGRHDQNIDDERRNDADQTQGKPVQSKLPLPRGFHNRYDGNQRDSDRLAHVQLQTDHNDQNADQPYRNRFVGE
ncbi:hypothetical protein D1872_288210 [compost metagenome]